MCQFKGVVQPKWTVRLVAFSNTEVPLLMGVKGLWGVSRGGLERYHSAEYEMLKRAH